MRAFKGLRSQAEEKDNLSYSFKPEKLEEYLEKAIENNEYVVDWDKAIEIGLYEGGEVEKEEEEVSDPTLMDREKTQEEHQADIAKRHKRFQEELERKKKSKGGRKTRRRKRKRRRKRTKKKRKHRRKRTKKKRRRRRRK